MDLEGLAAFRASLAASGIDVVQPFDVRWYNEYIVSEGLPLKPLTTFGRKSGAVGVLVGNSKALWPAFLAWLAAQPRPGDVAEPLDTYVDAALLQALACVDGKHDTVWPWEGGDRLCSMQRVAVCSALCYHDGETQLAIHPTFGSWIAFRAVVVFDAAPTALKLPTKAPQRVGCLLSEEEKVAAREAMAAALRASDEANLCTQLHGEKGMETDVRLAWAKLRDCVGVGREHRYSDEQLAYHYTKDKALLLRALDEARGGTIWSRGKAWLGSLAEVLGTFALPVALVLLVTWSSSGKRGLPGKPGDDTRLHSLAK